MTRYGQVVALDLTKVSIRLLNNSCALMAGVNFCRLEFPRHRSKGGRVMERTVCDMIPLKENRMFHWFLDIRLIGGSSQFIGKYQLATLNPYLNVHLLKSPFQG
jgi:hypothetical protein